MRACAACLKRAQLLALLAPWLMRGYRGPRRLPEVLALSDDDLLDAVCGSKRSVLDRRLEGFDADGASAEAERKGLATVCPHDLRYPNARLQMHTPDSCQVLDSTLQQAECNRRSDRKIKLF